MKNSIFQLAAALTAGALLGLGWSSSNTHRLEDQPAYVSAPQLHALEAAPRTADQTILPVSEPAVPEKKAIKATAVHFPIDSVEERDDAMLYEIDALQGTPFGSEITSPGWNE